MDSADLAALIREMTDDGWYLEPDDIEWLSRFDDPLEARQRFHQEYPDLSLSDRAEQRVRY